MAGATHSIRRDVFGSTNGDSRADDARGQQVHSSQDEGHVPSAESPGQGSEQSSIGQAASMTSETPASETKNAPSSTRAIGLNHGDLTG